MLNKNKVVLPTNDSTPGVITVQFQTNDLVVESDSYYLQLKFKEQILAQQSVSLMKSMSNYQVKLRADSAVLVNGGMMTVNLYKVTPQFILYT